MKCFPDIELFEKGLFSLNHLFEVVLSNTLGQFQEKPKRHLLSVSLIIVWMLREVAKKKVPPLMARPLIFFRLP